LCAGLDKVSIHWPTSAPPIRKRMRNEAWKKMHD
jgi:hypothetical protein